MDHPISIAATAPLICLLAASGYAGAPCVLDPLTPPAIRQPVAFTEEQEVHLGDAVAEHVEGFYRPIEDDTNEYLREIADRLLRQLPPSAFRFRFTLVDVPYVNAWALPGGRIYVTRKLVAFTRSEDELAGVLAHEIGHLVARHAAIDLSAAFRQLRVTGFGDRDDIFAKYHRLVDSRTPVSGSPRHESQQQYEADAFGMQAMARAGYSPAAAADLFDRMAETRGRTGGVLSDLFGMTSPESRRLRELLRSMSSLPPECRAGRSPEAASRFEAWRARVIAAARASADRGLHAIALEQRLQPPLIGEITHLRFSPDGRHILAQDGATVYVLSREPFEVLFQIEAGEARPAQFTPDSRMVVFHTDGLRVEWWDVDSRTRSGVFEPHVRAGCMQTALSSDGHTLACVDPTSTIRLVDVQAGIELFQKEKPEIVRLELPEAGTVLSWHRQSPFRLAFSPDGRYFVAGKAATELVVDLQTRREARLPSAIRRAFRQRFAFLGADRIATVDAENAARSTILRFPTGEVLRTMTLGGELTAATRGEYLLLRPIKDWAVGLLDLADGRVVQASKTTALDAYDRLRVNVRAGGELGLYTTGQASPIAIASLQQARLSPLHAVDVSPDLQWLALSGDERGGVWHLESGRRVAHITGFRGAFLAGDGSLYADFPSRKTPSGDSVIRSDRKIVRLDFTRNETSDRADLNQGPAVLRGRYLLNVEPTREGDWRRDVRLNVRDVSTDTVIWSRQFEDVPSWYIDAPNGRMTLEWSVAAPTAKREIRADPELTRRVSSERLRDGDAYLEVFDLSDGRLLGRLLVNTGRDQSRILHVSSSGESVVVGDRQHQISVYSLSSGERRGSAFGRLAVPSAAAGLLVVQNEPDRLLFFDLGTMTRKADMQFPSAVRVLRFAPDGGRLVVVTADQVVRLLDTAAIGQAEETAE